MDFKSVMGPHPSEPEETNANGSDNWLSVSEAVIFCEQNGLPRTPKTIRKWALRSFQDQGNSDLTARREDVENGFRWVIERTSLLRKIQQELEFEARRKAVANSLSSGTAPNKFQPVPTGAHYVDDELASVSLAESVQTGADTSVPVLDGAPAQPGDKPDVAPAEPVHTSADEVKAVGNQIDAVKQLEARIEDLKSEIEFYRDELRDRRHTTEALTDVIEAFRLTAQSNASKAFERTDGRRSHDIRSSDAGDRWTGENAGDGV